MLSFTIAACLVMKARWRQDLPQWRQDLPQWKQLILFFLWGGEGVRTYPSFRGVLIFSAELLLKFCRHPLEPFLLSDNLGRVCNNKNKMNDRSTTRTRISKVKHPLPQEESPLLKLILFLSPSQ